MKSRSKQKLAVFDIDGTVFRSSLLIKLVEEFTRQGLFSPKTVRYYKKAHQDWLDRKGHYDEYILGVIKAYDKSIKGLSYKTFDRVAAKVIKAEQNRTYRYTRDLIKQLKKQKYFVVAVSHSPKPALEPFCKALGFSKVYGIMYEKDSRGRLTGNKMFADLILNKTNIIKRILARNPELTLKNSIGVGDTDSDIAFLKLVDRPICFNPNKELYEHAKKRGWKIVVERKDVIYNI
jgi:HAD superfamily phosphoserine phosphatase-like hydrolase